MNEKEKYPGKWQGEVPEDLKTVVLGETEMTINLSSCLEYMEHLAYPVYKVLDGLKILDPACGTGEILIAMAAKYQQLSFTACDISAEALAQAQQYAEDLQLKNICFLSSLPEDQAYDFILPTRPLQHIDDLAGFLGKMQENLNAEGILLIHAYTGSQPAENLYLQDRVAAMKAGELNAEESQELIKELLAQPLKDHIDGLRECQQRLERAGFNFLSGLHPRNYEPASYLPDTDSQLFAGLSLVDRAYLAEQFSGQILRHSLLYTQEAYNPAQPSYYDPQASKYIPHLSPYVRVGQQGERMIVALAHQHLMLEAGIEFEDISLPEDLYRILPTMDGRMNCEQIHRRFLPLPWERFWALIQACWEEEIIYLYRPGERK